MASTPPPSPPACPASTNSTLHAAVSGAVGALKGPAHGGAAEEVMKMSLEIGNPENAEEYARNKLENRERIMGLRTPGL